MDCTVKLQKIYESETNIEIGWLWDGGIDLRLGDRLNGYVAAENVSSVSDVLPWLQEAIPRFYPDSEYARSLDREVLARAARRLFHPPWIGARVTCLHCGAPHATLLDEVIAFICSLWGNSVKVEIPKAQ